VVLLWSYHVTNAHAFLGLGITLIIMAKSKKIQEGLEKIRDRLGT